MLLIIGKLILIQVKTKGILWNDVFISCLLSWYVAYLESVLIQYTFTIKSKLTTWHINMVCVFANWLLSTYLGLILFQGIFQLVEGSLQYILRLWRNRTVLSVKTSWDSENIRFFDQAWILTYFIAVQSLRQVSLKIFLCFQPHLV